jgi:hypothetical protein
MGTGRLIVGTVAAAMWAGDTYSDVAMHVSPAVDILWNSATVCVTMWALGEIYHGRKRPAWMQPGDKERIERAIMMRHSDPVAADVDEHAQWLRALDERLDAVAAQITADRRRVDALLRHMDEARREAGLPARTIPRLEAVSETRPGKSA